jgi:hypothetical protein
LSRIGIAAAGLLMLGACASEPASNAANAAPVPRTAPSGLDLIALRVQSGERSHAFTVEVARTAEQQERGLMHRTSLGANEGMLFPFDPPRSASFWMRNTLIPLDLIFIRSNGRIARIATGTPRSEELVGVEEPVTAVLEIPGGRAAQLGIAAGDRVSWTD